jgi:hypothetical protein
MPQPPLPWENRPLSTSSAVNLQSPMAHAYRSLQVADGRLGKGLAGVGLGMGLYGLGEGIYEGKPAEALKGLGQAGVSSLAFQSVQQGVVKGTDTLAAATAARTFASDAEAARAFGMVAGKTAARFLPGIAAGVTFGSSQLNALEFAKQGRIGDASIERKIGTVEAGLNFFSVPGVVVGDVMRAGANTLNRTLGDGSRGELSMIEKARFFLSDMSVQQELNTKIIGALPPEAQAGDHAAVRQLTSTVAQTRSIEGAMKEIDRYIPNTRSYDAKLARTGNPQLTALLTRMQPHMHSSLRYDASAPSTLDLKEIKSQLETARGRQQHATLDQIQKLVKENPLEAVRLYGKNDPAMLAKYLEGTADERVVDRRAAEIEHTIVRTAINKEIEAAELRKVLDVRPQSNSVLYRGLTPARQTPSLPVAEKKDTPAPAANQAAVAEPADTEKNKKVAEATKAAKPSSPQIHA